MNVLELHILQSFPVTCLNRNDVGSPKTAIFGGVSRARVSSQSWKRAVRLMAKNEMPEMFAGERTRYVLPLLEEAFMKRVEKEEISEPEAQEAISELGKEIFGKKDTKGAVKTLFYITPLEVESIVSAYCETLEEKKKFSEAQKILKESVRDKADVSIFGRMVASDHSLTVEGAGMFSHAISTHKVNNEIDFFTAVDDRKPKDSEGAGHMSTNEFNSACYYRYIALNLDLLKNTTHLSVLSDKERQRVVETFIHSSLLAVPGARKNSMMGFNPPEYAIGTIRIGQPVTLINAFEDPVRAKGNGYVKDSIEKLNEKFQWMEDTYGFKPVKCNRIPETNLNDFCRDLAEDG